MEELASLEEYLFYRHRRAGFDQTAVAEIYDPAGNAWGSAGSLSVARSKHTATLLPNGKVCFVGGDRTVDLYDSVSGGWSSAGSLTAGRTDHTATLLPNGQLLVAGGNSGGGIASAELYDSANGNWAATGSLLTARTYSTATLLPTGKVLATGGIATATAELFDPAAGTWSNTGSPGRVHYFHTATLLPNGKVLVAGGADSAGVLNVAETYDPATGGWSATGALGTARQNHAASLLANGNVLVAGGTNGPNLASAEIYNSATGVWTGTGAFATARRNHTLTLLPDSKVLLAGGDNNGSSLASAQLYDPVTGVWTVTGSLTTARSGHTATLLPGGRVLVAGGANGSASGTSSSEIYNPATGTWTATGSLATARFGHTATLLPGGQVLVAGGSSLGSHLASAEIYNPATGSWSATGLLAAARSYHTATLLANGKVLVAAGSGPGATLASAQLYDAGLGFAAAWQPVLSNVNYYQNLNKLVVQGVRFRGVSGASAGNGRADSSTNFPVLQVRRLDNEQSVFLSYDPAADASATLVASDRVSITSAGHVLVTVFANGMPSQAWPMFFPGTAGITVEPSGEAAIADGGSATMGPAAVNASALRTFTIRNPGVAPLILSSITIDGADAGSFAVATNPASSVAPGGSTTCTIRFTPATRETKTAALHIPNNVYGSSPFDINLSGVILEPAIAVEQPAGSALASGGVRIVGPVASNISTNKPFTIKNTGGVNLTGFAITIDGPNAADFSILVNPAGTVAPGGSTTFTVKFAPASTGMKTAVLHIASNAANLSPYHVKLTGIAAEGKPFTGAGTLPGRDSATATLLPNGKVLVAGGSVAAGMTVSVIPAWRGADLYDPASGTWGATGSLAAGRFHHTATLLNNGKVLVAGGYPGGILSNTLASAELYDPASGTWSATGSLATGRFDHTATLLGNGKVLVTGGQAFNSSNFDVLTTAEIYDPATGTWTAAGSPGARHSHTATLLPNGKVLIAGGSAELLDDSALAGAQLYDPAAGNWSATGPLAAARVGHSATLLPGGKVLVAGGGSNSAELYNPATGTWSPTGSLVTAEGVAAGGAYHTATLLSNDKVLIAGGRVAAGLLAIAELYDPATGSWTPAYNLATARWLHTATALGGGRVLFTGGVDVYPSGNKYSVGTAELYDPSAPGTTSWVGNGNMGTARASHTATLLPDSSLLVAGGVGMGAANQQLASAEIKAKDTGLWTATGSLATARFSHTATLLSSGNATGMVLVAGGYGTAGPLSSAELYNPGSKTWTPTGPLLGGARFQHTATLLPNGKVLVTGGIGSGGALSGAEIYDPASAIWSTTGSLSTPRVYHTATLLPNGKVLVVGGSTTGDDISGVSSAELYDPATGFWTPAGSLAGKRHSHTATLLPNGKVLVVGGYNSAPAGFTLITIAEIYDPATGGWTLAGDSASLARFLHTATVMPNGKVLIAGGVTFTTEYVASRMVMIFDPAGNEWSRLTDITTDRFSHTATLLHSGGILLTGGVPFSPVASTELYDLYLNFPAALRPNIQSFIPDADGSLIFTGTGFLGITGFSPPTVQLRRLDNDQTVLLERDPATSPSATQFKTRPFYQIPYTPGYQMLTFTADGIPGMSLVFALGTSAYPPDIVVEGIGGEILPDGGSQSFGTPPVNYSISTTFTIRNPGSRDLTGINVTLDGANAADFTVTANPAATVAGGGSTTFTVRFLPATAGAKTAAIHIANNVPGKSPYDINLTGTAQASQTARELWRQQYFGTTSNTGPAADTADPDGDGQNNDFEFTAGLVPTDRNSRFNLRVELVPGLVGPKRIFFSPLLAGRTYVVQSTTSLTNAPWTVLNGIITDTGTERRVTDIDALMPLKFYRVQITLSP